jgi:hypothetical protein
MSNIRFSLTKYLETRSLILASIVRNMVRSVLVASLPESARYGPARDEQYVGSSA